MKVSELEAAVGGLSQTSKMPCPSWSISARRCKVGSKLATVKGTICEDCYALKGMYVFGNVQAALERRWEAYDENPDAWIVNMSELINRKKLAFFRFFDSGDLQSVEMLEAIVRVARACHSTRFWLPTKELAIVRRWLDLGNAIPDNLTIRLSAYIRDRMPPHNLTIGTLPCSTVTDQAAPIGYACPSKDQGNKCADCRACWDKSVSVVSYYWH